MLGFWTLAVSYPVFGYKAMVACGNEGAYIRTRHVEKWLFSINLFSDLSQNIPVYRYSPPMARSG